MRPKVGIYPLLILLVSVLSLGLACTKAPDDGQLTAQIQAKLGHDSGLQGKPITVQTSGGVVTLAGTVENDAERTAAARYASEVSGVKMVVNNLQMTPTAALAAPAQDQTEQTPAPKPARPVAHHKPSAAHHGMESSASESSAGGEGAPH